jgi:hypothetical protein
MGTNSYRASTLVPPANSLVNNARKHTLRSVKNTRLDVHILDVSGLSTLLARGDEFGGFARHDIGTALSDAGEGSTSSESLVEGGSAHALDGKGLGHDRAPTSNDLKVRHGAAPGGRRRRSRESSQSTRGGLLEEGAQATRLVEERLHGGREPFVDPGYWWEELVNCCSFFFYQAEARGSRIDGGRGRERRAAREWLGAKKTVQREGGRTSSSHWGSPG